MYNTYMLLGLMSTATAAVLAPEHPVFRYYNGGFKVISQIAYEAMVAAEDAQEAIDQLEIRLIVEFQQRRPSPDIYRVSKEDKVHLETLVAYINDHFAREIPQSQMIRIACMGATKLKATFHQVYGCTITEYIQHRRMAQAEQLLSRTDLSIGQIAFSVGYFSASRFSELFRRSTGMLPSDYREKVRQDRS